MNDPRIEKTRGILREALGCIGAAAHCRPESGHIETAYKLVDAARLELVRAQPAPQPGISIDDVIRIVRAARGIPGTHVTHDMGSLIDALRVTREALETAQSRGWRGLLVCSLEDVQCLLEAGLGIDHNPPTE